MDHSLNCHIHRNSPPKGGFKFLPAPEALAAAISPRRGAAFGLGEVHPSAPVPGARSAGSAECRHQNQRKTRKTNTLHDIYDEPAAPSAVRTPGSEARASS